MDAKLFFCKPCRRAGKGTEKLTEMIRETSAALGCPASVYLTRGIGDGERKAREMAEALAGAPARFYACGGDGTLNEIINGAAGSPHVAVGCVPTGTGNDMVRNFPEAGDFRDIAAQLQERRASSI